MTKCACGCGRSIPKFDTRGRLKKFHPECFSIGKPLSDGAKKYISKLARSPERISDSLLKINRVNLDVRMGLKKPGNYRDGYLRAREDGYLMVLSKSHPNRNKKGYVFEHILVMEKYLGRFLKTGETIHHKNRNRRDNRIENLHLCSTPGEHQSIHAMEDNRRNELGRFK